MAILESPFIRFKVSENGSYEALDKQTNVIWRSSPYAKRLGSATVKQNGRIQHLSLDKFAVSKEDNNIQIRYDHSEEDVLLTFTVKLLDDEKTMEFSFEASRNLQVENLRLFDDSFWITNDEGGYVIVPVREGLLIPSNSGRAFTHRFETFVYEGCHIEMLGMAKKNSVLLVTWHDPYVTAEVKSTLNTAAAQADQILSTSLDLTKTAKAVRVRFLGKGDYTTIAKAYRKVAMRKGWFVTLKQKINRIPDAAKLVGASNFKLWSCLDRRLDYKMNEQSATVNWTFEEAAQVAEHLKRDLNIDKALFIIGGWIRRGYDNQHPDILPACPECGGNKGLAETSKRVKELGYLFCLHDNYQDLYKDAPSWNEDYVMKAADGSLVKGGFWAGGRAYLICSKKSVELAQRKKNLPMMKTLFKLNAYFIDTTFASGLQECFDPNHPLTRWYDMKYKQALCDYTISLFGVYGSECGKEWGIPHAHFFEGLGGVSGRYYHGLDQRALGGYVIPLFEMIYRDCIAVYGKYGYIYEQAAEYVLHHIIIGRPLHYHSWGSLNNGGGKGLYWQKATRNEAIGYPYDASCFVRADNGWAEGLCLVDRFIKNTHEVLSPLYEITADMTVTKHEFLTPDKRVERVVFNNKVEAVVNKTSSFVFYASQYENYVYSSKAGGKVVLPPFGFVIESPTFIAFHAFSWNGIRYNEPVLFTIRSLDGKPIAKSGKIRVFHGFGDQRLKQKGKIYSINKEVTLTLLNKHKTC